MKRSILIGLSVLTASALMTGCGGSGNKSVKTESDSTEIVLVKTIPAIVADVENSAEFTSNIQAFKENNIAPSMPLRIDRILVDVGAKVSRGQLLAQMDATQYHQAAVQFSNTEADYKRVKSVYEAGGISKQQLDQIEATYAVQKKQTENLQINTELRSPIDGVVTARNYDPGDMYGGAPILTVMQINKLKVSVAVSEQYFPLVKTNMPAEISVDMYPDKIFDGKVSLIYPAIDPQTRTFNIEITIPNPNQELRPGMFSRTKLRFGTIKSVLVEDIAVQKQLGSNDKFLYIVKDDKAERLNVVTGRQVGEKTQIISGVSECDQVIVAGISKLKNGIKVDVRNDLE